MPFSTPDFVDHMKDFSRSVLTKSEDTVDHLMAAYNARYVVLDQRNYSLKDFFLRLLKNEPGYSQIKKDANDVPFLFLNNLLFFDGELRWRKTPGVKHFRLVYEVPKKVAVSLSSAKGPLKQDYNGLKIFERVPGAVINLQGLPKNSLIMVQLPLLTNTQRMMSYTNFYVTGADGKAQFTVPYPTEALSSSAVHPMENKYTVFLSKKPLRHFFVMEKDIQAGSTLQF